MRKRLIGYTYLPGIVLKNILDVLDGRIQILKTGSLLMLQFILKLGSKLKVTCRWKSLSAGSKEMGVTSCHKSGEVLFLLLPCNSATMFWIDYAFSFVLPSA